ncbi:AbrB/MazE/SpoVT family DNA-binding domain-containing protein [Aureimonas leprariae]|uniref:AbrB/MazE/SpoVT family DNA-binding domain-containing protein n=1 Tax=Plantimonas leprariae TaxID=2615207 RepID=A0A7V7TVH8_9HYPH|nr:AbrB/MazE/SpoVT family DNA-binding domain-containing protein [Aureimonas leprariae]KAB0678012.1 AbrB/MazE/SpoVT family DNA-binding domain-containing protein [Aureimonas leprariae]
MRLTEKSQVTIPKPIRDRLGIGPGSEIDFLDRGDFVEVVRKAEDETPADRRRRLEAHLRAMAGTLDLGGMTTDEYMEEIRGPRDDLDPR